MKKNILFILLLLNFAALRANPMDSVRIEFITCSPGSNIYELEGHAGLRIFNSSGEDMIINWGLFDFDSDNFVYRFVKGETDYMVGAVPTAYFLPYYARENRSVMAFPLNLTAEEKQRITDAVRMNLMPENRVYRYNYVKDNCSTRPLTLIEQGVGDTLTVALPKNSDFDSYRRVMQHYHANYPWYQLGIDIALGRGIDTYATPRELLFAPALVEQMLPDATIHGRQIVSEGYYLVGGPASDAVDAPTPWYLHPIFWGILLLAVALAVTVSDIWKKVESRWFDTLFYTLLFIISLVVTFLVFASSHEATSPNLQLLIFNPLTIIGVVGIWIKRAQSLVFCWQIVNFVALIMLLIMWLAGYQYLNPVVILLTATDLLRSIACIYVKCSQRIK